MATGLNTYTNIAQFVQTIFEDALFVARDQNLMQPLVTVFTDAQGMASRKNQEYGTASIQQVGESDDLVSQTLQPSPLSTLTPAEYAGQFFITDLRMESDPFGARDDAALELGVAMAKSIEHNLISTFTSVTGGTVGTAGTVITWGHIMAARARLQAQNAPLPYACVLHAFQWNALARAASIASNIATAPNFTDEVTARYRVASALGVDFFVSNSIPVDANADAVGALFSRQAIALDLRRAPRMEPERDASRRGLELNMSTVYAYGVWRPKFGIQMVFDATAPDY